jgi:Fungal specific transcription factor domain
MRNESGRTPDTSKEIRYRVWWSLYALEHKLSVMTGRPPSYSDETCTTPLPAPIEEDAFQSQGALNLLGIEMQRNARYPGVLRQNTSRSGSGSATSTSERSRSASKAANTSRSPSAPRNTDLEWAKNVPPSSSLYFFYYIQLTRLSQTVINRLYTPEAIQTSWSHIQTVIADLDQKLSDWHSSLPTIFDFKRKQRDQAFIQLRMCLGLAYYGTRILVHRPCMCRLDRKMPAQSVKSRDFNRASAATCIDSAREMLQMIPDEPNAVGLNRIGPWWCILHRLMQATVILLLELSLRSHHMPEEAEDIFGSAKKAVRWLHSLGEESYSARRAWTLCDRMLRDTAPKIGREVDHLPERSPGPLSEPVYSNPQSAILASSSVRNNPALVMTSAIQSGDNFSVAQSDLGNMTAFAGYDEYISYPGGEQPTALLPTFSEMDFLTDRYNNPSQQERTTDHRYSHG